MVWKPKFGTTFETKNLVSKPIFWFPLRFLVSDCAACAKFGLETTFLVSAVFFGFSLCRWRELWFPNHFFWFPDHFFWFPLGPGLGQLPPQGSDSCVFCFFHCHRRPRAEHRSASSSLRLPRIPCWRPFATRPFLLWSFRKDSRSPRMASFAKKHGGSFNLTRKCLHQVCS